MSNRLDELYEIYKKQGTPQAQADENASNNMYDTQKTNTQNTYNKQIQDTTDSYDELYRENAVQKLINEREIAENMANLGLTDSGLNRTQQTAVQLSYANQKGKLDTSRQKAVDTLAGDLAAKISEIEANKLAAAENIRSNYEKQWQSNATTAYNNEVENARKLQETAIKEETERLKNAQTAAEKADKAAKEAAYIIKANGAGLSYDYFGSLKDNGVWVTYNDDGTTTYVDQNSGKKTTMKSTKNPYTFTINPDAEGEGNAFSNGYQPNNIDGVKLKDTGNTVTLADKGRTQKVFSLTKNGKTKYYTWDSPKNEYSEVYVKGNKWVVK